MLSAIFSSIGGALIDKILGQFTDLFKAYFNKQISLEELKAKMLSTVLGAIKDIEVSHADLTAKTYESFQVTLRQSKEMQRIWCWVVLSQLGVLLWHQMGIPALCYVQGVKACYPSSGSTVEWAYALIAFMFGAGAVLLRSGPGAGSIASQLKDLLPKK